MRTTERREGRRKAMICSAQLNSDNGDLIGRQIASCPSPQHNRGWFRGVTLACFLTLHWRVVDWHLAALHPPPKKQHEGNGPIDLRRQLESELSRDCTCSLVSLVFTCRYLQKFYTNPPPSLRSLPIFSLPKSRVCRNPEGSIFFP